MWFKVKMCPATCFSAWCFSAILFCGRADRSNRFVTGMAYLTSRIRALCLPIGTKHANDYNTKMIKLTSELFKFNNRGDLWYSLVTSSVGEAICAVITKEQFVMYTTGRRSKGYFPFRLFEIPLELRVNSYVLTNPSSLKCI